jgi:hypothetical protein
MKEKPKKVYHLRRDKQKETGRLEQEYSIMNIIESLWKSSDKDAKKTVLNIAFDNNVDKTKN